VICAHWHTSDDSLDTRQILTGKIHEIKLRSSTSGVLQVSHDRGESSAAVKALQLSPSPMSRNSKFNCWIEVLSLDMLENHSPAITFAQCY